MFTGGTGQLSIGNTSVHAPRFSWELHNGPIPDGLYVLHRCDNPPCVNPKHLFLGTADDNSKDMISKDRQAKGEDHGQAVLTEDKVRLIRKLYRWHDRQYGSYGLAKMLGVSQYAVMCVIRGETWGHIK